jgi:hypothetical protein
MMKSEAEQTALHVKPAEFMHRFKDHVKESIRNCYSLNHGNLRSTKGILTTALPEDLFMLINSQTNVLVEFLNEEQGLAAGDDKAKTYLVEGLSFMFQILKQAQSMSRILFLTTLDDSCAAANDFFRIAERLENYLDGLSKRFPCLASSDEKVQMMGSDLVTLYSHDAVFAAERSQVFVMRRVQSSSIPSDFFSKAWENDWTSNEVCLSMTDIFENHLLNVQRRLCNDYLYQKALVVAAKAMVCFYVRCLVEKADSVNQRRRNDSRSGLDRDHESFASHHRALLRIADDVTLMTEFWKDRVNENAALWRMIVNDLGILELIIECLGTKDTTDLESFILVIHQRTGADMLVTRYFVADLWLLMGHRMAKTFVKETVLQLQPDLEMVTTGMRERSGTLSSKEVSFVRLDEMLKALYEDRVAQGILPACWACLPKVENEGNELVVKKIRSLARNLVEMQWKRKAGKKKI